MITELVEFLVLGVNSFPPKGGFSKDYKLINLLTGTELDLNKHCKFRNGAYLEANEDPETSNRYDDHTVPYIFLQPTSNFQGSYKYINLNNRGCII